MKTTSNTPNTAKKTKPISKSLFVEFLSCPILARYHRNDKDTYKYINDQRYGAMDGAAIGQEVEDMVAARRADKQIVTISTSGLDWRDRHGSYHRHTMFAMGQMPDILAQPGFVSGPLFCKVDFLLRNEEGTYDIIEVKSKTSIRKTTKDAPLLDDLLADVSLQHKVVQEVLGELYSGRVFLAYLDKSYSKQGAIDPAQLTIIEEVTDEVMDDESITTILDEMSSLSLSLEEFQQAYPYAGENHLLYFGEKPQPGSIFTIPRITRSKRKLLELYDRGTRNISNLDQDDMDILRGDKPDNAFVTYVELFHQGKTIDNHAITEKFAGMQYPLYFYDYETVTVPVPIFEQTRPWQQVIVQYSLHRIDEDGTVTHHQGLIDHGEQDNRRIIDQLVRDLTATDEGTYIVWYKPFENSRNTETGLMYPEYADAFAHINANTFDLMDIFKDLLYFDPAFGGSSSIKNVLPVLTDISYEFLPIGNGGQAAHALGQMAKGALTDADVQRVRSDLLGYCRQDTWAMVAIWLQVCKEIGFVAPELRGDVG